MGCSFGSVPDVKTVLLARIGFPPHIDVRDSSSRRPGRTPLDRFPDIRFFTLEDGLYSSIPQISDPAAETERERDLSRERSIEDSLDSPVDEEVRSSFLHIAEL